MLNELIVKVLKRIRLISRLRILYYRIFYKWGYIGKNIYIGKNVIFQGDTKKIYLEDNVEIKDNCILYFNLAKKIHLAKNVSLERFNVLNIKGELYIGENTMTAPFVSIVDANHNVINKDPIRFSGNSIENIFIDKNVWIATGSVILKGVNIGEGAVVGANSVVNKNIPEFSIVAGSPAKIIKQR
jgi:acetyltransferase-like isoleucine patch superfamily enzyme